MKQACVAITFPLSTAFSASHRFSVAVSSLSFVSSHILISFLMSSVICWLFTRILVSLHVFVFKIYLFVPGCVVSASHGGGFSYCRAQAPGAQASSIVAARGLSSWHMSSVAPWPVGFSWSRDQTGVLCIVRWSLNH